MTAVTHLLITKYILKLAGICGCYNVNNYSILKMAVLGENIANKTHHKH